MKHLIVIGGATATGKTAIAIRLAGALNAEILSADSRQFYREMRIGTAKPHPEELRAARHHFIDTLSVTQDYSVGDYERAASAVLDDLFQGADVAILVGGSGLFINAVCSGLDEFPDISKEIRDWVENGFAGFGLKWMQDQVALLDPEYFKRVDQKNPARLRRALEVCLESGKPYSSFLSRDKTPRAFVPVFILLELPRTELYARIDARVDAMIEAGLESEARQLLPFRARPALRTVGYEEWFDFFDDKMSREETIAKIKQHSRNYAKRQATWFRKHGEWAVFHPNDWIGILEFCRNKLEIADLE